jgi:hypothetical protein
MMTMNDKITPDRVKKIVEALQQENILNEYWKNKTIEYIVKRMYYTYVPEYFTHDYFFATDKQLKKYIGLIINVQ